MTNLKQKMGIANWLFIVSAVFIVANTCPISSAFAQCDCADTATTGIPEAECEALLALYADTDGPNWTINTNWNTASNCATWYGVWVEAGSVVGLELSFNQLSGMISPALENLTNLLYISLNENQLTGSIPPELGNLTNLWELSLSRNQLSGSIPPELGNLENLTTLSLIDNQLTGGIPPELGNLVNLQKIYFRYNQLTGVIPTELGNLTNLMELFLDNNQLAGVIPTELGFMMNLRYISLGNNQLTGNIPTELGNLMNLWGIFLQNNQLTGAIPPELGNLANLDTLWIHNNHLTGAIPAELGNLTNLQMLILSNNLLTGTFPPELGNLANLQYLQIYNNQLTGNLPPEIGNLTNLTTLDLFGNQLTNIPPELGNLTNLTWLSLSSNELTGNIPPELGHLSNLQRLYLNDNELTGNIPPELGGLANLEVLYLSGNHLAGAIPPELGNLTNLTTLALQRNLLEGEIPSTLTNLTNLAWAYHDYNKLTASDPGLIAFLNIKAPNWENTQTIPPGNPGTADTTSASVRVTWTPIPYTGDGGYYRVYYSTTPGGPYTEAGTTADKHASGFTVAGLAPGTTYHFVVETFTPAHDWQKNDLTSGLSVEVSATTLEGDAAEMLKPFPDSTLGSATQTFEWNDSGAERYWLRIGTAGIGSFDVYSSDQGTKTSCKVSGLPESGETVYVRLFSMFGGKWFYNDFIYTACDCASLTSEMLSPAPGSILGSTTVTFVWENTGSTKYWLRIGTAGAGSFDIYSADQKTNTSRKISGLPGAGETLYVRLFTMVGGSWRYNDYTYTACDLVSQTAEILTPIPETAFASTTATFEWNDTGAEMYWLRIGTTGPGSFDIYSRGQGTATSRTVSGLPNEGETVYVRLFSMIGGSWAYNDYTYTAIWQ